APLAGNGGATWTHALMEGSSALDVIPPGLCTFDTDMRGWPRTIGTGCDIGAYEAGFLNHLPLVTRTH
ncbi:MAG: hypothetical protein JXA42_26555, partial [Anaerolineales bacterium]|nr:hypothetical protein [Anaerolineales bacterium]